MEFRAEESSQCNHNRFYVRASQSRSEPRLVYVETRLCLFWVAGPLLCRSEFKGIRVLTSSTGGKSDLESIG